MIPIRSGRLKSGARWFAAFAVLATAAQGAWASVERDPNGMPRCIASDSGGVSEGLLLDWSPGNRYWKDLRYALLEEQQSPGEPPRFSALMLRCSEWRSLLRSGQIRGWKPLKTRQLQASADGTAEIAGYRLSARELRALAQLEAGGSVYREVETPAEHFALHPIRDFDRKLNRDLTRRNGVAFTMELYRLWQRSKPANRRFESDVNERFGTPDLLDVARRFPDTTILVAKELGSSKQGGRVRPLLEALKSLKLDTRLFKTDGLASVEDNSEKIRRQVREVLAESPERRVVLAGASKGVAEMLLALREFPDEKRILAMVSLSGAVGGALAADYLRRPLIFNLAKAIFGVQGRSLDPFENLSTRSQSKRFQDATTWLPKHLVYVNVIGTPSGNGLVQEPFIKAFQDRMRNLIDDYGANDGHLEYPGAEIPAAWAPRVYSYLLDGSHLLLDGSVQGRELSDPAGLREFTAALMHALADRLGR